MNFYLLVVYLLFPQLDEFSEEEEEDVEESNDRLKSQNATFTNGNNTLQQGNKDIVIHTYSKSRETLGSFGFNGKRKV